MNRLKLLAMATLMALTLTACDEGTPPPIEPEPPPDPVGTISGTVTIDGSGAAGLTATLSSGATQTTNTSGAFSFADVVAGSYTVTISGHPEDVTFPAATQSATIASNGQTVQLNFPGQYIRSSSVVGNVVASDAMMSATNSDAQPDVLAGVTVTLTGDHAMAEPQQTDMSTGGYAFTGLRAGTYTVEISGYPEDVKFDEVSMTVEVGVGDVGKANFEGAYIRTSAVEGRVIIEGEGLAGVMVTLVGGPGNDSYTKMTGANGEFTFTELRPGDYQVSISGYDAEDYEFASNSHDVSVDLDETETVSFTGVLLRTSGISGRVGVPGMGLPDIAVTLSGAADESAMTDASGQYAFSGLAAGDYTVSIAVTSDAYVFESMSSDVTLGDDDSQIVNFEGAHATTASVSGMLFLDELDKNNAHDAGEHPLPQAGIPLVLVGPGVNDTRGAATNAQGQFTFPDLRAGSYQLIVPIDAKVAEALMANDIAYGGPAVGYTVDLAVGERETRAIPFDITHTTISFSVSLRSGEKTGDALPGASVTLYGAGSAMVGSGMTGDDGSVAIKVDRARTSGNMVNAGVSAEGYDVADGMTAVSWNPQMFATAGANENDIVNLNVNVNINGATVDRGDYGGGEALAGWAISVMSGDAAVPGAPTALGSDGSVAFTTTVASVPATFTFAAAEDQEDELDGGEMYESSGGMYTHYGLSLAGTAMDADPIVVTYTTQTLKVYVHQERDQVYGYTGNVLGGDERMSDLVDIEVRHVSGNDGRRTSAIPTDAWDARAHATDSKGEYTFKHLPADMDIVVRADPRDGYMLLDLDRLDTYRNFGIEENGVMGGAFGAMGGWGHTVELCPLTEVEPTGQDFGPDCGSFAVVSTHDVSANVSKKGVAKSGTGFNTTSSSLRRKSGITVSLTPIEGKNLAGVGRSFTTASSNDPTTPIDERTDHDFGTMAAGAYELGLPDGWMGMVGDMSADDAPGPLAPLASDVELAITPSTATLYGFVRNNDGFGLEGVTVTVNGMTATTDNLGRYIVSGIKRVRPGDTQFFVNTARAGYPETKPDSTNNPAYDPPDPGDDPHPNPLPSWAENTVERHDFTLRGANNTVTITGVVTRTDTNTGLKGVEILVDVDGDGPLEPAAPLNPGSNGKVVTGDDGAYTALVEAKPFDDPLVTVSPKLSGWHFIPDKTPVPAIPGANGTASFTGYQATEIVGRVTAPGGGMAGSEVTVRAYGDAAKSDTLDVDNTSETGTFSVKVPTLSGTVWLDASPRKIVQSDYSGTSFNNLRDALRYDWYDHPANRPTGSIAVIPGQTLQFGTFTGNSVQPRITSVERVMITEAFEDATTSAIEPGITDRDGGEAGFALINGEPTDTIVVTWHYETRNGTADLPYTATDGDAVLTSGAAARSTGVTTPVSAIRGTRTSLLPDGTPGRGTESDGTTVRHDRITTYTIRDFDEDYRKIKVKIGHAVVDADGVARDAAAAVSAPEELAAVKSAVTGLKAVRKITVVAGARNPHVLTATWKLPGSPQLEHRIALYVQVEASSSGTTVSKKEWIVFGTNGVTEPAITRSITPGATWGQWSSGAFDLNGEGVTSTGGPDAWQDDDDANLLYTVTSASLKAASHLRIDTRVDDGGKWVKYTPVAILPGPGG